MMLQTLKTLFIEHTFTAAWIAISGGLDSVVLTDLYYQWQQNYALEHPNTPLPPCQLIHFHHGLSPNADQMAEHCRFISKNYRFPLEIISLNLKPKKGESIEALARTARYEQLTQLLKHEEMVLTAHHQDDQAETLLLQLIRGAGVQGLAAMPQHQPLGHGFLLRPLLSHTRLELHHYAQTRELSWIEDATNEDERFDRNFIRKNIMPTLRKRWPSVSRTLARSAQLCADTAKMMRETLNADAKTDEHSDSITLSLSQLKAHSREKQSWIFRQWLEKQTLPPPTYTQWKTIVEQFIAGNSQTAEVKWGNVRLVNYQNQLWILPQPLPTLPPHPLYWDIKKPLVLTPALGVLKAIPDSKGGLVIHDRDEVTVQFRQGGEWCWPIGRVGSHPLKKCLQEWKVPPLLRKYIPLIYINNHLSAIANYAVCHPSASPSPHSLARKDVPIYQLSWEYPDTSFLKILKIF